MIMGTPMTGVIAFIGIIPIDDGSTLNSVHSRAVAPPNSIVAGRRVLWFELLSNSLAM